MTVRGLTELFCNGFPLACVDNNISVQVFVQRLFVGKHGFGWFYVVLIAGAFVLIAIAAATDRPLALIGLAAAPLAIAPTRAVLGGANAKELIGVLGATGKLQLGFGVAVTLGLALGG